MPDLTPQPISTFPEITNLNGFNNDSLLTLLNANASTPATKNANLKFKNLYTLVKTNLNLTDADINTGINPANINTNQLASIASITVDQYGRVVQIAGSPVASTTPQAGVATDFFTGKFDLPYKSGGMPDKVFGIASNFICQYDGKILITVYFAGVFPQSTGSGARPPSIPIYVTNNTNIVTQMSIVQNNTETSTGIQGKGSHVVSGVAIALLTTSANTTNWKIGTGYYGGVPAGFGFNYSAIFQNNAQ